MKETKADRIKRMGKGGPPKGGTPNLIRPERTCVYCGCTDSRACPDGCGWVMIHPKTPTGICSACQPQVGFKVILMDEGEHDATLYLPFAPFVGLYVQVPWLGMDVWPLTHVYWIADKNRFEVFIDTEEDEE